MLRSVFAIAFVAACHPAPTPTVVHATPVASAAIASPSPIRQDFELTGAIGPGPLHEVLATGHECRQERQEPTGPLERRPLPAPIDPLEIMASPTGCSAPFVDGHRRILVVPANYR